jgi:proteasome lid subunit RPN8/RPN11
MNVKISTKARETMLELAAKHPLSEVCGLLFGQNDHIEAVSPVSNVAPDPRTAFELDPATLFAALRSARAGGPPVIGYFHSHPNGLPVPSATDIAMAQPDNMIWIILGTDLTAWRSTPVGFQQLRVH